MGNPDGPNRGPREVSGVDSGELALACVHYAHSTDPQRVPTASALFLRWMARHLEDAADALDEAPESLSDVAETTGEAMEVLSALLDEIRRDPRVARVARSDVADVT